MKPQPASLPNVTRRISWLFGIGVAFTALAITAGLGGPHGASEAQAKSPRGGGRTPTVTQSAPSGNSGGQSRSLQEW